MRTPLFIILTSLLLATGCSEKQPPPAREAPRLGARPLVLFSPGDEMPLMVSKPLALPPETPLVDALSAIGRHLSSEFFGATADGQTTGIEFRVQRVETLLAGDTPLRVAIIDLRDPQQKALSHFFQGSSGATATFHLLVASFTQPQLAPPLLDGIIFNHNGQPLGEMDHINLSGILVPRLSRNAAHLAMHATNPPGNHAL